MQTLTKVLLFGFPLGLATSAAAEHFNDHSSWVTSNSYPEPPSEAQTYASISSEFNESNRTTKGLLVSSKGPILCSVAPPWSKASGDPYQIPNRFNDKYSNPC